MESDASRRSSEMECHIKSYIGLYLFRCVTALDTQSRTHHREVISTMQSLQTVLDDTHDRGREREVEVFNAATLHVTLCCVTATNIVYFIFFAYHVNKCWHNF